MAVGKAGSRKRKVTCTAHGGMSSVAPRRGNSRIVLKVT